MTYVMSDLHGCYDLYSGMLAKIKFSNDDALYILGDVIDRGKDGIKILLDIMNQTNVRLLMGNHEYLMAVLLSNIKGPIYRTTVLEDQKRIVSFLVKLPLYTEVSINHKDYVFVHSGFDNFSLSRELKDYTVVELLEHRYCPDQVYFTDKLVIVGHTPTFVYGNECTGKFYGGNNIINVDCGCVYPESGVLGCLRIEDLKEFYVK